MALSSTPLPSDRATALAERFGMTREAVEELLHQTHAEYPAGSLPPAELSKKTPIEQAADAVPVKPIPTPPAAPPAAQPLGGGFIAGIFIVLLIALGVALSFRQGCFHRRTSSHAANPVDTIQTMMRVAAKQASAPPLPATTVPPEVLVVPREEPPGTSGPPSKSGITTESQASQAEHLALRKPTLVTSSNFDAEEKLAQLHAEGKSRSYMKAARTYKGIRYSVFSR